MCGRFSLTLPADAMARIFAAQPANDLPETPDYNICPTTPVATVTSAGGQRRLRPMRWGFIPRWYDSPGDGPLLINARAETLARKPAFAEACRQRRALIPATGFYEWTRLSDGTRLPWHIARAGGAPLAFAAIWQDWGETGPTAAIVTCAANAPMARIHHRMPVILEPADWPLWLGEAGHGAATLMRPTPDDTLAAHRVSRRVNSNRAEGPALIEPFED